MVTILLSLLLTAVVVVGLRLVANVELPRWSAVVIYLAAYWLLARVRRAPRPADAEPAPSLPPMPTSGPIGRLGQPGLMAVFYATNLLALLNPWQLWQVSRQLIGNNRLQRRERDTGDDRRTYRSRPAYRLPFDGQWLLYNGGDTPRTSHSWDVLGQRYALDFVVADDRFARHQGRGTRVTDYLAYGREILAAASGEVVAVEDRIGDAPLVGWGVCDFTARSFIGNHVVIRHAEGEYALYAHLIRGSVTVAPGDAVTAGQVIGRCGHSGHSSEPHLHFHVQDSPDLFEGMGLPVTFVDVDIDGVVHAEARLTAGQRVRHAGGRLPRQGSDLP